ncbi:hypothetical protein B0A55_02121 [Lecanosticta acicola]|uniref:Enoyl reductase (ER) domain-containing protein n=1 Tax=Lecanosticta acicola TaxID=111012 RepID=A0AAI9E7K1_9PEZI|nr:hypothetical protein B0A55_02121 [Lecanosticta acicola]
MASTTTEAYVARASGISLEKVTYSPLAADEILVDIVSASVCHSDVKAAQGTFHLQLPLILGHEGAGYVKAIGSSVTYVQPGDAVVLTFTNCGKCRRCLSGKSPYCDDIFQLNFSGKRENGEFPVRDAEGKAIHGLFFGQSSMSRIALVKQNSAVKIEPKPETREELKIFAALGCGIQTGAGAILNIAHPPPSSTIAIFGAGAVGLSAVLATLLSSPTSTIILIDNSPTKLHHLLQALPIMQHVTTVDSTSTTPDSLSEHLKSLTPEGRGLDFALDCVGNSDVTRAAHMALDKCGLLLNVGSSATARAEYTLASHLVRGITVRGTHQGDSVSRVMVPHLISLWRKGRFPFDGLLSEYKFQDLNQALEDMRAGRVVKPLLVL